MSSPAAVADTKVVQDIPVAAQLGFTHLTFRKACGELGIPATPNALDRLGEGNLVPGCMPKLYP